MVFPSIPVYLDPPHWQQQLPTHHPEPIDTNETPQLPPLPPIVSGDSSTSSRPGSMADRAKLAKIPQPEAGLKCPRCDSTKTKFCYFNNYSLTQPRHFCKTCRRYWTRGGALRNVPVGGGCRRNKKTKNTTLSKSNSTINEISGAVGSMNSLSSTVVSHGAPPHLPNHLPFMSSLSHLPQYQMGTMGLNFTGVSSSQAHDLGFQMTGSSGMLSSGGSLQLPFFDPQPLASTSFFSFPPQAGSGESSVGNLASSRVSDQLTQVKMEERQRGQVLTESGHFWQSGGASWTDLTGLNSSNNSHLM